MNRLTPTFALVAFLCACTASQIASTAQQVQQVCQAGAPIVAAASSKTSGNPTATALLGYAQGVCTASGAVVTATDPTGAPVNPAWLEATLSALQLAAAVAPVVLPLL